jgi:hypothetical protein
MLVGAPVCAHPSVWPESPAARLADGNLADGNLRTRGLARLAAKSRATLLRPDIFEQGAAE